MHSERINSIEKYILEKQIVSIQQIAEEFGISINTVRRDINILMQRGNIHKEYGGVAANHVPSYQAKQDYLERHDINLEEKKLIGKLAAGLVNRGDVIFLDSGTTTPYIIDALADIENLTVVTNNLMACQKLLAYPKIKSIGLGGILNTTTASFTNISSEVFGELFGNIRFHTVFMAASSISTEHGAGTNTFEEFQLKKNLVNAKSKIVLLVDHSKFDKYTTYSFCSIDSISVIVTDRMPPQHFNAVFEANGIRVICPETGDK